MTSIARRLFLILSATTGLVWLSAAMWIYFGTRAKVEHVLDARLVEAASMVDSLISDRAVNLPRAARLGAPADDARQPYEHQLSCQIWSLNGLLVGRSDNAPAAPLTQQHAGFSVTRVNNETWRSYAIENQAAGMRILVGDNVSMRGRLVGNVMKGLLIPGLAILPLLAALTWFSVRRGLAPLRRVADALGRREADDLRPLPVDGEAAELRPVVSALNHLLSRLGATREREKNFTAFAAHELRTPLAGLKTHAQLALGAKDRAVRAKSLSQILVGIDRTSRLVRQLLDMVTAEGSDPAKARGPADVGRITRVVSGDLAHARQRDVSVMIDPALDGLHLPIDPDLFALAVRNIVENAILHSPVGGVVRCHAVHAGATVAVTIDDSGQGIPPDELSRVTERFYRGVNKTAVGSGLGLSIAARALVLSNARLELENRVEGGLRVQIWFAEALACSPQTPRGTNRSTAHAAPTEREARHRTDSDDTPSSLTSWRPGLDSNQWPTV